MKVKNMELKLATISDINVIMNIITDAKEYLKNQGLKQWNLSDGYPREEDMLKDIKNEACYLLIDENEAIGTMSIIFDKDENYDEIYEGQWLTTNQYASIHRIAIKNTHHKKQLGKVMLELAEEIVKNKNITSIKIDTHKNNIPMTKTILYAGYTYCGIIKLKRSNIDNLRDAYKKKIG